jgi:hypothetical protein
MGKGPKPRDPMERFREKYVVDENGCWVWTAFIRSNGYGQFADERRKIRYAHRWSYERFVGDLPAVNYITSALTGRASIPNIWSR